MLLLFLGDSKDPVTWGTSRNVQSYRFMAMKILAEQILRVKGPVPAWKDFSPGPIFAIRDLPVVLEPGDFDWWDPRWDFDPSKRMTEEELRTTRELLMGALLAHPASTRDQPFYPVTGDKDFPNWYCSFQADLEGKRFPPACWF